MSFEDINKIKSTDFLVLRSTSDGTVDGVIAPNGLQVGLDGFTDKSLVVKTAVEIQSRTAPEDTDSKLYNIDGTLYFNGSEIGSGGGATASGSNGEFQFANASGDLDAAQVFWDSSKIMSRTLTTFGLFIFFYVSYLFRFFCFIFINILII